MTCDLYVRYTKLAHVHLNSVPSTFVITSVVCATQYLAFPFALSVHMLCTYICAYQGPCSQAKPEEFTMLGPFVPYRSE